MNVYIVYSHPNPDSLNHAVLSRLEAGLKEAGHEVAVSDLYADKFGCALTKDDLAMAASGEVSADVKAYQDKLSAAEGLVLIFPIWWFSPPAILKGWFDRVFSKGFAYDFGPNGLVPKLKIKKALVLSTAGGMEEMYKNLGFADAMNKLLVVGTLQFCGVWSVKYKIFHNAVECDDSCRADFLDEVQGLGREYFQ